MAALCGRSASALIVISTFNTSQEATVSGAPIGPRSAFSGISAPSSIGGAREFAVSRTSNNSGRVSADANDSIAGAFSYAAGPATTGVASLQFDGSPFEATVDPSGLGGVNLIEPGTINNRFQFDATSDLGGDVTVNVFSGAGNSSSASIFVPADPTFNFQSFFLPFSAFAITAGAGADFTNVGAIEFVVGRRNGVGVPGLDLALDLIAVVGDPVPVVVPEPSTLLAAGVGVLGLALAARRRRAA